MDSCRRCFLHSAPCVNGQLTKTSNQARYTLLAPSTVIPSLESPWRK